MNWLFALLFLTVPSLAYANVDHRFEQYLYNNVKITYNIPDIKEPKIDLTFVDYIPSVMQIYINSFALQQYNTNNYTIVAEKLTWKEVKIGVRYYF